MILERKTCWSLAVSALICVGCGSSGDQPDLGTVSGVVTLDGSPLSGVVVDFSPENGRPSSGTTNADGKYELIYALSTKGAKIGKHTVSISSRSREDGEGGGNPNEEEAGADSQEAGYFKGNIPRKYNTETTLSREVKAGDNTFDFKLESK